MVQNEDWGPPLWRILHTVAEKLGRQTVGLLAADEVRTWVNLLQVTEGIMPCALCRKHYGAWKKAQPPQALLDLNRPGQGMFFREAARKWLWDLHEAVNERKRSQVVVAEASVPVSPTLEELESLYGARTRVEFQEDVTTLVKVLQKAALLTLINPVFLKQWQAHLSMLRPLIGI